MHNRALLIELLDEVYRGPAWHGPSVRESLAGVTAEHAAASPFPERNSIWDLVLHLAHGRHLLTERLLDTTLDFPREIREPWWPVVTWYHVELPEHGLLMAEGAPAESYFDAGNRHMFGAPSTPYETPSSPRRLRARSFASVSCPPRGMERREAVRVVSSGIRETPRRLTGSAGARRLRQPIARAVSSPARRPAPACLIKKL